MVQAVDDDGLRDELGILSEKDGHVRSWSGWFILRAGGSISRLVGFTYHFLNHVHDLLLDQIKALRIASRSAADDIVNFNVIVFLAHSSTVHGVGELDED